MMTPFVLRLYDFANGIIFPKSLAEKLVALPAFSRWARQAIEQESVMYVWEKDLRISRIIERLPRAKAKYANA